MGESVTCHIWQAPPGYNWKVVVDPTRTEDHPGIFYGGHFRWSDIVLPSGCRSRERIPCPWPSGTVFENIRTGELVVIKRGRPVMVREKQKSQ
jgi:hypothetical protein